MPCKKLRWSWVELLEALAWDAGAKALVHPEIPRRRQVARKKEVVENMMLGYGWKDKIVRS